MLDILNLENLYSDSNNALLTQYQPRIYSLIPKCVESFYEVLLSHDSTQRFISTDIVKNHLNRALSHWLEETLSAKNPSEFKHILHAQKEIGHVHARTNINMSIVFTAMVTLKNTFHRHLSEHSEDREQILLLVNNLLDNALLNINQAYFDDHNKFENQTFALKTHLSTTDFAIEIQEMRTSLHEWFSLCLINQRFTSVADSEFYLWAKHKLSIAMENQKNFLKVDERLNALQVMTSNQQTHTNETIQAMNVLVKDLSWNLAQISKTLISEAEKKDTLTKLYNRRFLDSIMIKETEQARKLNKHFSVLMLDVDLFKKVNDEYGHQTGDKVLSALGNLINQTIRISDFAFRFGGEEFLILLNECQADQAQEIYQKISDKLTKLRFAEETDQPLQVSVSGGIAEFDDEPDYQRTIKNADKALYQSKHNGRNQVTIWNGSVTK